MAARYCGHARSNRPVAYNTWCRLGQKALWSARPATLATGRLPWGAAVRIAPAMVAAMSAVSMDVVPGALDAARQGPVGRADSGEPCRRSRTGLSSAGIGSAE